MTSAFWGPSLLPSSRREGPKPEYTNVIRGFSVGNASDKPHMSWNCPVSVREEGTVCRDGRRGKRKVKFGQRFSAPSL